MIIGNNNGNNRINNGDNFHSNFEQRFNLIKEEGQKSLERQNPFSKPVTNNQHPNITNQREMADRSFDILQERLNNGLISLEEFNRKCNQLNKTRRK